MQKRKASFRKRILSIFLACCMLASLIPAAALANEAEPSESPAPVVERVAPPAFPTIPIPERNVERPDPSGVAVISDYFDAEGNFTGFFEFPFQNPSLTVEERVNDLIARMTLDEKIGMAQQFGSAVVRLGIRQFRTGSEGEHGLAWMGFATSFPAGTGLGMTFDKKLLEQIGYVVGTEMRAYNAADDVFNANNVWSPVIDLNRDPRFGRASEGMGEDAFHVGVLAKHYSEGMKGYDPFYWLTQPTLKHFYAYGQESVRNVYSASICPRNMHEYYLKVFEIPIASGAAVGLMTGYNMVNGKAVMTSPEQRFMVFDQWVGQNENGFYNPFIVVNDASSPRNLYRDADNAYYPQTLIGMAMAYARSIQNFNFAFTTTESISTDSRKNLYAALAYGFMTEDDLDAALRPLLATRVHLGCLDPASINYYEHIFKVGDNPLGVPELVHPSYNDGRPETHPFSLLSLEAAEKQVVVLRNENNILPLDRTRNVAVSGPVAAMTSNTFYAGGKPYHTFIDEEIENKLAPTANFSLSREIYAFESVRHPGHFMTAGQTRATQLHLTDAVNATTVQGNSTEAQLAQWVLMQYPRNMSQLKSLYHDNNEATRALNLGFVDNRAGGINVNNGPAGWYRHDGVNSPRAQQDWNSRPIIGFWETGAATNVPWRGTGNVHIALSNSSGRVATRGNGLTAPADAAANLTLTGFNATNSAWIPHQIEGATHAAARAATAAGTGQNGYAIVVVGDNPHLDHRETYDRIDILDDRALSLGQTQTDLIEAVSAAAPGRTVLVVVGNAPFEIDDYANDPRIAAIVYTSHAGQEMGRAVANVLFGDTAPAGRLGETWYADADLLAPLNDYDIIRGQRTYKYADPANTTYPFGFGLTFANLNYGTLTRTGATGSVVNTSTADLTFSIPIANTSNFASDEVVQLYMEYTGPSILTRPIRRLVDFNRHNVPANGSTTFTFSVPMHELAIWDVSGNGESIFFDGRWYVEPGTYTFIAATCSAAPMTAAQRVDVVVTGAPIGTRNISARQTLAWNWDDVAWSKDGNSHYGNDVAIISSMEDHDFFNQHYLIQSRTENAWVRYNNVSFTANMHLTARASNGGEAMPPVGAGPGTGLGSGGWGGSADGHVLNGATPGGTDGPTTIRIYQVPAGQAHTAAHLIGTMSVPLTGHIQTLTNVGAQTTSVAQASGFDLVLEFSDPNMSLKWFQAGEQRYVVEDDIIVGAFDLAVGNTAFNNTVRETNGAANVARNTLNTEYSLRRHRAPVPFVAVRAGSTLLLEARVDATAVSATRPIWEMVDGNGNLLTDGSTGTIDAFGVYQAPDAGSGTAYVRVRFDVPATVYQPPGGMPPTTLFPARIIEIAYRGTTTDEATVQFVQLRSGRSTFSSQFQYGAECYDDAGVIRRHEGELIINAVAYPFSNQIPGREIAMTLHSNPNGTGATNLAEWVGDGASGMVAPRTGDWQNDGASPEAHYRSWNRTLRATGMGNGNVYIRAVHVPSGSVSIYRVLIENQGEWCDDLEVGVRDLFRGEDYARIQAEMFDVAHEHAPGSVNNIRVDNKHGNGIGLQVNFFRNTGNWMRFSSFDFSNTASDGDIGISINYMKVRNDPAIFELRLDSPTGPVIADWTVRGPESINMQWMETPQVIVPASSLVGVHDLYLTVVWPQGPTGNPTWITNSNVNARTAAGIANGIQLGVSWLGFEVIDPDAPDNSALAEMVDMVENTLLPTIRDLESYYTADSVEALEDALEAAQDVLEDPDATQEEIDEALENLRDAVNGLELVDLEIKALKAAIQNYIDLFDDFIAPNAGNYVLAGFTALSALIDDARDLVDDLDAEVADLTDMLGGLEAAFGDLELRPTPGDMLAETIAFVDAFLAAADGPPANIVFTDATRAALDAALDAGRDPAAGANLATLRNGIITAFNNLEVDDGVRNAAIAALQASIEIAEGLLAKTTVFTDESLDDLYSAVAAAKAVLDDPTSTVEELVEAMDDVVDAINDLILVEDDGRDAAIAALQASIDIAEGLLAKTTVFTGESLDDLYSAVAAAKAVLDDPTSTVEELAEAMEDIVDAIDGLALREGATRWFIDVNEDDWFYEAVIFAAERGIVQGKPGFIFDPYGTATRAEFVAMLCRAYGIEPLDDASDSFYDARTGWFAGYVAAAKEAGVVEGVGGNMFAPDSQITRAEMFTMLYRALLELDELPTGEGVPIENFVDHDQIPYWALTALTYLVENGIVRGVSTTTNVLEPNETSNRASAATVFFRLLA
ncbi:MAG: glycoside hydrolase family 3 C-terminal domain-containing protein [Oscillospiraceae bacterium]|nr:glycoside hydrolase family 3 C-terminal domain-containing protein [Oscillospiraceae bacterium]